MVGDLFGIGLFVLFLLGFALFIFGIVVTGMMTGKGRVKYSGPVLRSRQVVSQSGLHHSDHPGGSAGGGGGGY
ncbi:hypothetical protein [Ornithinimicrobium sp. INDO-MA30-4]|uniref:hypothetical protein n=1 Tax=Ornithinimicrobium sp. INDO-MA30-4 TaxID=2908651 RepID=UPI001F21A669|nr:hypothetical protein [Ornithinimicrobium sp. INDO-MA30-4]UJH71258.1 hypothetical protein L0A91_05540 [Ornithinimicrobium sp. INDO-MA30-4]